MFFLEKYLIYDSFKNTLKKKTFLLKIFQVTYFKDWELFFFK